MGPRGLRRASSLSSAAIERIGGRRWAWAIPTVLPVTDAEAAGLAAGGARLALCSGGEVFGVLEVDGGAYRLGQGRLHQGRSIGTERTDHPGARLWTADARTKLVGGTIHPRARRATTRPFAGQCHGPDSQTRSHDRWSRGCEQSIAFQTRNPLHRAHEYALVYGAEVILRDSGKKTGVVLNPLVGQLKGDDVPARDPHGHLRGARVEPASSSARATRTSTSGPSKGQDLDDQLEPRRPGHAHVLRRPARGRSCTPSTARTWASPTSSSAASTPTRPSTTRTAIWGDFDAQDGLRRARAASLAIKTVNVGFAAYFEELGRVGLMEANKDKTSVFISGTKVREQLVSGENPDPRIMRETTAAILVDFYKTKGE